MLVALLVAVVIGACLGGWQSLHHYRELDLQRARRCAWRGALAAVGSGIVLTFVLLGWPWREQSATPEVILRQIEKPVRVPFLWLFWQWGTEQVNVPTVSSGAPSLVFDGTLIFAMLFLGGVCAGLEWLLIRARWRWFG